MLLSIHTQYSQYLLQLTGKVIQWHVRFCIPLLPPARWSPYAINQSLLPQLVTFSILLFYQVHWLVMLLCPSLTKRIGWWAHIILIWTLKWWNHVWGKRTYLPIVRRCCSYLSQLVTSIGSSSTMQQKVYGAM